MEITEVRVKLMGDDDPRTNERLLAFASITIDDAFVVRDLKIIEGARGVFVAMPSRKLADRCPRCGAKNHLLSRYCNACGCPHDERRAFADVGRPVLHSDVAHPVTYAAREQIERAVLAAYNEALVESRRLAPVA